MAIVNPTVNPTGGQATVTNPPPDGQTSQTVANDDVLLDNDYDEYEKAKIKIDRLITDFGPIARRVTDNRNQRFKLVDIEQLKKEKRIPQDAYLIPMRMIDMNIRREQPAFTNYLKQSRRLVIFKCIDDPNVVTTALEDDFTRGMTYSGWDIPHFKVVDGSQTHGWDAVEVMYDKSKPFHAAVEHIAADRLLFYNDTIDIQSCEIIARHYTVTAKQLKTFVREFNFDSEQVKSLISEESVRDKGACINIYKCFYKKDGIVMIAWYSQKNITNWLKAPEPLYLGITIPVDAQPEVDEATGLPTGNMLPATRELMTIDFYPIFILPYYETEQCRIRDHHGRVFLDLHKQEAVTANISQFLNGCQRASRPIPSAKVELRNPDVQSQELNTNKICPIPLDWNAPPYPDSAMLNLQQYLDTLNSQETGQINFAAQNRKDSRKTATEISAAQREQALISSVQVSLYSNFIREVYSLVWKIVQSEALAGNITLLYDPVAESNNIDIISRNYDIRAAGDVDVIKRGELIQQYKEFWPIIQNTPAAVSFLSRLVRLVFSDEGEMYAKIIEGGDPRAVLTQLVQILNDPQISACVLEAAKTVPPEQKMILTQVLEQAQAIAATFLEEQAQKNPNLEQKLIDNTVGGNQTQEGINDDAPTKGGEQY